MRLLVKKLDPSAQLPTKGYEIEDAGLDLYCLESGSVPPNGKQLIRTGISIAMEPGYWGRIVTRSSTLGKNGLIVIEGVIDNGWRGELFVQVMNPTPTFSFWRRGERLAQLIPHKIVQTSVEEAVELPASERGINGFGSTGR